MQEVEYEGKEKNRRSKLLINDESDGEFICKKVKGEESAEEEGSEDIAIEELEESEDSDKEHKIKKAIVESNTNEDYIYVDKLPHSEIQLKKLKEQVELKIKKYKMTYFQEACENQNKKSDVDDDAIPICTDVRLLDFEVFLKCDQKLRETQLKCSGQLFDAIMMDPPWQLSSSQPSRGVAIAYSSLADDSISKMPIDILQDNGVILIWTINAKYKVSCKLIQQWGYKLVDEIVWCKKTVNGKIAKGHGFYLQHAKENCLVGVKGNVDMSRFKKSIASDIIFSQRRGQSQKPEEIYRYVEELIPNGNILRLFQVIIQKYLEEETIFARIG